MKKKEIYQRIEKILDKWDPIGILQDVQQINYSEGAIGEYNNYIEPIINVFLSNKSMYDYLIALHADLRDDPNEVIKEEIKLVANQIVDLLSKNDIEDIQENS